MAERGQDVPLERRKRNMYRRKRTKGGGVKKIIKKRRPKRKRGPRIETPFTRMMAPVKVTASKVKKGGKRGRGRGGGGGGRKKKTVKKEKVKKRRCMRVIGSRRQVWNGTKLKTAGGLTRDKLMPNKRGKIVSRKASETATNLFVTKFFKMGLGLSNYARRQPPDVIRQFRSHMTRR